MENVNPICDCSNGWTEAEKKQADAVAGGSFEKILVELQILRTSFGERKPTEKSGNPFENSRASDIRDIFFLQNDEIKDPALSFFQENSFLSTNSKNQFENSRASDIRDIFFLQQEKLKDLDPEDLKTNSEFNLEDLRRDLSSDSNVPLFLEKKFPLFGPTVISRFV